MSPFFVAYRSVGFVIPNVSRLISLIRLIRCRKKYFIEWFRCLSIINAYTQYGRIANPPERKEWLFVCCTIPPAYHEDFHVSYFKG